MLCEKKAAEEHMDRIEQDSIYIKFNNAKTVKRLVREANVSSKTIRKREGDI